MSASARTSLAWALLVSPPGNDDSALIAALHEHQITVAVVDHFEAATRALFHTQPAALLTHLRLGPYNGLHLVLRARELDPEMPAFLIATEADAAMQREAAALGAHFVAHSLTTAEWVRRLDAARPWIPTAAASSHVVA